MYGCIVSMQNASSQRSCSLFCTSSRTDKSSNGLRKFRNIGSFASFRTFVAHVRGLYAHGERYAHPWRIMNVLRMAWDD